MLRVLEIVFLWKFLYKYYPSVATKILEPDSETFEATQGGCIFEAIFNYKPLPSFEARVLLQTGGGGGGGDFRVSTVTLKS